MNDVASVAGPTNWKKGALVLFVIVAVLAAAVAFLMPSKHVEGQNAPAPTEHRASSPGFSNPVH
jgi:hypothetical protein